MWYPQLGPALCALLGMNKHRVFGWTNAVFVFALKQAPKNKHRLVFIYTGWCLCQMKRGVYLLVLITRHLFSVICAV
jgi:hypothetical protein